MTTLRYWAAARAAAGVESEQVTAPTLAEALAQVTDRRGPALERVLQVCSYVLDGAPVGRRPHEDVALPADGLVDVLPPFAGG